MLFIAEPDTFFYFPEGINLKGNSTAFFKSVIKIEILQYFMLNGSPAELARVLFPRLVASIPSQTGFLKYCCILKKL